jgi:hypothetical protein
VSQTEKPHADLRRSNRPRATVDVDAWLSERLGRCETRCSRETNAWVRERAYLSHGPESRFSGAQRSHRRAERENGQHPNALDHRTESERLGEGAPRAASGRSRGIGSDRRERVTSDPESGVLESIERLRRRGAVPSARVTLLRAPRQDGRGCLARVHYGLALGTETGLTAVPNRSPWTITRVLRTSLRLSPAMCTPGWTAQRVAECRVYAAKQRRTKIPA